MKTARFIFSLWIVVILLPGCGKTTSPTSEARKYNIILIAVDTLRADHLHCYGYQHPTSPHLDAFAQKVLHFEYAFCPIPKTSASFASMLTGLHPFIHKTKPNRDSLKEKFSTLAEVLKANGYHTAAIVDNANLAKKYLFNQGFDSYTEVWNEIEEKPQSTPFITAKILSFLKEKKEKPFFLWVNYIEPHAPYMPPQEFVTEQPGGRNVPQVKHRILPRFMKKFMEKKDIYNEGYYISLYDGAVRYVDSEIGKILQEFYRLGLDKNTIFIFTADHGEELGEWNLFYNHGPLTFTSSIRVPLLVYIPGQKPRRIKIPVSVMDLYPTLLARLNLELPYPVQGVDLLRAQKNRTLYIIGHTGTHAVVKNNYHYINVDAKLSKKLNLAADYFFDIYADPYEKNNLYRENNNRAKSLDNKYIAYFNANGYFKRVRYIHREKLSEKEKKNLETLGYL
jgi:arylsulfatase A-like enzyme